MNKTYLPVAGASVTVKGENTGTVSDAEGNFSLSISSASKTIIVTSVGYAEKELNATAGTMLDITLTQLPGHYMKLWL